MGLVPRLRRSDPLLNRFPGPSPDFLWTLVASVHFMRLSSWKGAHAASSSAAWQEIRGRALHPWRFLQCHCSLNLPQAGWTKAGRTGTGLVSMECLLISGSPSTAKW
jgi:hypothetical protein